MMIMEGKMRGDVAVNILVTLRYYIWELASVENNNVIWISGSKRNNLLELQGLSRLFNVYNPPSWTHGSRWLWNISNLVSWSGRLSTTIMEKLFEKSHLHPPLIMFEMKLNRLLLTLVIKSIISNDDQL